MTDINPTVLKDIAAAPGYGTAKKLLQSMGHWDEFAGDGDPREFHVRFKAEIRQTIDGDVTVMARSEEEARSLAEVAAKKGKVAWAFTDDPEDWDIVEVEDHGPADA